MVERALRNSWRHDVKKIAFSLTVLLVACALAADIASAQGRGRGRGNSGKDQTAGDRIRKTLPPSSPVFTVQERTIVTRYFAENRSSLPPGLAKRDRLPPGLEKQLRQRGTLPPGLQKRAQPLPIELERQLTLLPTGYRRVVIGGNVILMNEKTAVIYDIVRNVIH
jgi:hypothetical protein